MRPPRCAGGAQAGRAGARILGELGVVRADRAPRDARSRGRRPQRQTGSCGGHTQPRRSLLEGALHEPVLERVVGDHAQAPARAQRRDRGLETLGERAELVVHRDAQRLEDERGGMVAPAAADARFRDRARAGRPRCAAAAAAGARPARARGAARRAARRSRAASPRARPRSRARAAPPRSRPALRIHAHVERRRGRARLREAEAARGRVELVRRDAEVEQHAVDAVDRRARASTARSSRNDACTSGTRSPKRASRCAGDARARRGSRSSPIRRPPGALRSRIASAWPPPPSVPSTTSESGRRASQLEALGEQHGPVKTRWRSRRDGLGFRSEPACSSGIPSSPPAGDPSSPAPPATASAAAGLQISEVRSPGCLRSAYRPRFTPPNDSPSGGAALRRTPRSPPLIRRARALR